jgi:pseudouridine kinase
MSDVSNRFATVTVFGGATFDRIARTRSTPVMSASNPGTVRTSPGGVGLNVASILARLGIRTRLATRVGDDADGKAVLDAAIAAGVDMTAVTESLSMSTATYLAAFDDAGELIVGISEMSICDEIIPDSIPREIIDDGDADFWVIDANLPEETIAFLVEEGSLRNIPVAALSVSPAKAAKLLTVLDRLSVLFANRREASVFLGRPDDPHERVAGLAVEIAGAHPLSVVVTDGASPLAVASGGQVRSFAPLRARVAGVNGAGDSFAAGTIQGLVEGLPLHDAIRHGLVAAVLTLEAGSVAAAPFLPGVLASGAASGASVESS